MFRTLLFITLVLSIGIIQARASSSGLVICRVTSNPINEVNFKTGERFLLAYSFDSARITWTFSDGTGREIPCKANGDYLTCPWYDGYSVIFSRRDLTLSFPNTIGPTTSESACKPININLLP